MRDLTLIIPAKNEKLSLPHVLDEIKDLNCKKIIILEKNDNETINSIKRFNYKIIKQKKSGYGSAIIEGINNVKTKNLCIFNADGSFDPKDIKKMLKNINKGSNFVFASRYINGAGSDDDTFITFVGNKIFTYIGKIFFNINITDILYTYIMGRTDKFIKLNLKSKDFRLCIEIPFKISKNHYNFTSIPSFERRRIAGKKNVREFIDGFLILYSIFKFYFKNDN